MAVNPHLKIYELITDAVGHHLSVPEFQRGFVWKPTQVRDLAESLWLNYPIGSLLIWNSQTGVEERVARDARRPSLWIVDGQQRTSALCILFGRKPYWWSSAEDWDRKLKRYDIRLDVEATEPPFFWVANAAIRKTRGYRWIKLSKLLNLDTQKKEDQHSLQDLAREIKNQGLCNGMDAMEVYARLDRVRKIREKDLVSITVDHELEDVVEIFARLNSRGTRVTEADIYLGVVAAKAPGWVRDEFLPFLNVLKDYGFDLGPNLLFRSVTAIAAGKTRFRDIGEEIWDAESIKPAWVKCKEAWKNLVKRLAEYGVLSNDPLPTEAALVTLVALQNKFPNSASFDSAFYWFLEASRFGRYSGSGTTAMDEDLRDINEAPSSGAAISRLLKRFDRTKAVDPDEFMRDYSDARFGRFLLYLILYKNQARDWDERGYRLGFEGPEALADFRPQWHHIFPVKFLEKKVEEEKINALANIAVIGSAINIKISKKDPMDYLDRYKISDKKLEQQFVPIERNEFRVERFDEFLEKRAETLAREANDYLGTLGQEVASVDNEPPQVVAPIPSTVEAPETIDVEEVLSGDSTKMASSVDDLLGRAKDPRTLKRMKQIMEFCEALPGVTRHTTQRHIVYKTTKAFAKIYPQQYQFWVDVRKKGVDDKDALLKHKHPVLGHIEIPNDLDLTKVTDLIRQSYESTMRGVPVSTVVS